MQTKQNHKFRRLLTAGAILFALAAAALFIQGNKQQYLLLTNERSGQTLLCLPVDNNRAFAVSFTHSVNKSPVIEYYRIEGQQIYLDSLRYYTFGAGMPHGPEAGQTLRYAEDGAMIIEGFDRALPRLSYTIGRNTAHTLLWQNRETPLSSLDTPGQSLLFSVQTLSPRQAWLLR